MSTIIIDGISASGKSILLQGIQRISDKTRANYTKLFLSEHMTERFFENQKLTTNKIHNHVARVLRLAFQLQSIHEASPFAGNSKILTITIERLFLTLLSRKLMTIDFFLENDKLIRKLTMKNIFLIMPVSYMEERIAKSLTHRNQAWCDYINKLGGLPGAVSHFEKQQDKMWKANEVLSSYVPTTVLEVKNLTDLSKEQFLESIL